MIFLLNDHKAGYNIGNHLTQTFNKYNYPFLGKNINSSLYNDNHNYFFKTNNNRIDLITKNILKKYPTIVKDSIYRKVFYLFHNSWQEQHKYIILVRDPREILISGYLYHSKCKENWAVTSNNYYYDFWETYHFDKHEVFKNRKYIEFSKKFSRENTYQNKINQLNQEDGILFELENVAYLTLSGMMNLNFIDKKNVYVLKFEDYQHNFDVTIEKVFDFLKTNENIREQIKNSLIDYHLVKNQNPKHLAPKKYQMHFITNIYQEKLRYEKYFTKKIKNIFYKKYSGLLQKYKYL